MRKRLCNSSENNTVGCIATDTAGRIFHEGRGSADFNAEPGLNSEAGLFLAERDVALIGADNYAVEVLPFPPGEIFPVHQRLIRDYGIPLLEGLVLKPLAESGARDFLFMAAALPIVGGTGSPLTPVAVL